MSRRTTTKKRLAVPDPVYNSRLVSMLTVRILKEGKKHLAQRIIYQAFDIIREKTGEEPLTVLESAIRKVTPLVEVKARRVGGSTYQVPVEVKSERALALALRWLIGNARNKKGVSMIEGLSSELLDAYNNIGLSVKKREESHKMAESNKAFAHFRF